MGRMPAFPLIFPKNKRRSRKGRVLPPARRSARCYVYIDPSQVHLFRYFLEAEENLGIMTVVDRWRAALLVRFSPDQERRLFERLEEMRAVVSFTGPFRGPS
ncbi:MAG: DUF4911 domain-containing protein [Desulfovibrionaceae bacterium]|nr:DUF4911 domain-containing protein [Desulfovibrionaceae bacterium]